MTRFASGAGGGGMSPADVEDDAKGRGCVELVVAESWATLPRADALPIPACGCDARPGHVAVTRLDPRRTAHALPSRERRIAHPLPVGQRAPDP